MPNDKLKLPTGVFLSGNESVSDPVRTEILKTERSAIEGAAKAEVARLQVAQEAIAATRAFFEVFKSYNALQATRFEWEGRVNAAEVAVRKAVIDLETAEENNKPRMEELAQSREALKRLFDLFDDVMNEATNADLPDQEKREARQFLLQLSNQIVQLKK